MGYSLTRESSGMDVAAFHEVSLPLPRLPTLVSVCYIYIHPCELVCLSFLLHYRCCLIKISVNFLLVQNDWNIDRSMVQSELKCWVCGWCREPLFVTVTSIPTSASLLLQGAPFQQPVLLVHIWYVSPLLGYRYQECSSLH
jgi:hypothetical protein